MPQIRQNVATGEWVIIAPQRARRPGDFAAKKRASKKALPEHVANCPFCPGNESQTPPQVLQLPSSGPWQVRVVPNKFAAFQKKDPYERHFDGVYRALAGVGWHEVVIESRRHNAAPAFQTSQEIARILTAFQLRGIEMAQDPRVEQIVYLKNHGRGAGTSREHPHSQIIALPVVPPHDQRRVEAARRYFDETGECVFCQMWRAEGAGGERVVVENEHFVVFVPYAAFASFHTWIVPRRHRASFCGVEADELAALATLLRLVLRKIYVGLGDPAYNYLIHSAPLAASRSDYVHWYVAITPRPVPWGGFEMGSGMFVNATWPEEDARLLRATNV